MTRFSPLFVPLFGLSCLLALGACSAPPAGSGPGDPVTETVTPAGGSVSATDTAGNTLTIDFPAAAVPEALAVTLTPQAPPAGAWASFGIEPAGTPLAVPAILTLTAAPGTEVANSALRFGVGLEGSPLPTEARPNSRTLEAETTFLGFPDDGGSLRRQQGGIDPLVALQIECDIELTSLQVRFERARLFPFSSSASAKELADQIRFFIGKCEALDPDYDALISRIQTESCIELSDAEADAAVLPPTTRDELLALSRRILDWAAAAEGSSAPCTASWLGSVEALFLDFIARYRTRVNGNHLGDYTDHWNDLRLGALPLLGDTMALDLGAAQSAVNELIADLIDALRTAGYRVCRDDDTQELLANLYTGGDVRSIPVSPPPTVPLLAPQGASSLMFGFANFSQMALEEDMQRCGSQVDLDVWLLTESFPDKRATVQGGATEGSHTPQASTQAPVEGELQLSGEMLAMNCPSGYDPGELVLELDGTEVERLSHSGGNFFASLTELDVETILSGAGIDSSNQSNLSRSYPLTLVRDGSPCGGDYGPSDYTVFTFDVQFDPAPDVTSNPGASPGTVAAEVSTDVTFTLPFEDVGENIEKITGRFTLAGNPDVITLEWTTAEAGVSGFSGPSGSGTVTTTVLILCSEAGSDTVTVEFALEDAFGQTGDEKSTVFAIDYSSCSALRAGQGGFAIGTGAR